MSKVIALYHIVFCTKYREMTIPEAHCEELYRYIWSVVRDKDSKLLRINGIGNHVHLLIDLNPATALADFVRDLKSFSSGWLKKDLRFPDFKTWAEGYYACTVSPQEKSSVIEYIKSQKLHHEVGLIDDELQSLYFYADMPFDPRDMTS